MIKQGLELKQTQKLSPLQIQTIKVIELPIQELQQRIREEFESNPVIDDEAPTSDEDAPKDISLDELKEDDYIPSYNLYVNNWGKDARPEYNTFSVRTSFRQSLVEQLGCRSLNEQDKQIALFVIGSLDSDGYLRRDIESLVDDMAFRANIYCDSADVERILAIIQEFEPAGVGARDLRECLLLQLRSSNDNEVNKNARRILEECFTEFTNKHFQKIMLRLDISQAQLKSAMKRILKLNPAPGGEIEDNYIDRVQQIVPDFVLNYEGGRLSFSMPRFSIPEVHIKSSYAKMLENANGDKEQREAATFVKQKIDSAKWFVESLKQRQNTLNKTMTAILEYQTEYFETGDESSLKPMVLKDIAQMTGFDISTISRVVNSKYIETHFGVFPLKYFFSEGMENKEGEEVSTRELKKALQECIDNENKKHPLTDEQLVIEMGQKGYKLARRTIAKYRSQLGIPLARWRKEL